MIETSQGRDLPAAGPASMRHYGPDSLTKVKVEGPPDPAAVGPAGCSRGGRQGQLELPEDEGLHAGSVLTGGFRFGQIDLELHPDLVAQLERTEETGVRLDPERGLNHTGGPPVPARPRRGHLQPGRLRSPVQGERALDRAAAGPGRG